MPVKVKQNMRQYRVIIAGGRDFSPEAGVEKVRNILRNIPLSDLEFVSGMAPGADQIPFLLNLGCPIQEFPAEWDVYGLSAGFRRNTDMAFYGTHLIAFWDGKSKGTKHMIDLALKYKLTVKVIRYTMKEID